MEPEYTCILEFILRPVNPASSSSWEEGCAIAQGKQGSKLQGKRGCKLQKALGDTVKTPSHLNPQSQKQPILSVSCVSFQRVYAKASKYEFYSFLTN